MKKNEKTIEILREIELEIQNETLQKTDFASKKTDFFKKTNFTETINGHPMSVLTLLQNLVILLYRLR